jgi:hypothetical protein
MRVLVAGDRGYIIGAVLGPFPRPAGLWVGEE